MKKRSPITTHILDTARGKPASGIPVILEQQEKGAWTTIGKGQTNADGRVENLLPEDHVLKRGTYRLTFETKGFYPVVAISFNVENSDEHYHIPLLLSPHGYTTYRGS